MVPAPDAAGVATITLAASDGSGSFSRSVSVTVLPVNDAPRAFAQAVALDEDQTQLVTLAGTDVEGSPLALTVLRGPAHGALTGGPPNLTYTPAADFAGSDDFTFQVRDGDLDSAPASVSIVVRPLNDLPVATGAKVDLARDTTSSIAFVATDVDGDALTFQVVRDPEHGALTGTPPTVIYTPDPGYVGPDSFEFEASDPAGSTSRATVSIVVHEPPRLDVVSPDRGSLEGGTVLTLTGDHFVVGVTVTVDGLPCTSVAVMGSDRIVCFTPAGELGYAHVTVTNPPGFAATARDAFFYEGFEPFRNGIVQTPGGTTDQYAPSVASYPGGPVACAWLDTRNRIEDVYATVSQDGGATWSMSGRVNDTVEDYPEEDPAIAVGPGSIVCAWIDQRQQLSSQGRQLRCARSLDGGGTWSASVRIDDDQLGNSNPKKRPALAFEPGGSIVCVWEDQRGGIASSPRLRIARSADGGATWSTSVVIDPGSTGDQKRPRLVVDAGGALVCVWEQSLDIVCGRSTDVGATWTVHRVDDGPGASFQSDPAVTRLADGTLVCAWSDQRSGVEVRCARSANGGVTWSGSTQISDGSSSTPSGRPTLAADPSGVLLCAWDDRASGASDPDVCWARSLDLGATWTPSGRLDDDPGTAEQVGATALATSAGFLCVWADGRMGHDDVRRSLSADAALTWSASDRVNDDTVVRLDADPDVVYEPTGAISVAWSDRRGPSFDIFFSRSVDDGRTWTPNLALSEDDPPGGMFDDSTLPALALEPGGALVCAWRERIGGGRDEVVLRRSTNGGATWSPVRTVSEPLASVTGGIDVAIDAGGGIVCVWLQGTSGGPPGQRELRSARSADAGLTWSPSVRISASGRTASSPSLAATSAGLFCAWADEASSGGPTDVLVARSVDDGATWAPVQANTTVGIRFRRDPRLGVDVTGGLACVWWDLDDGIDFSTSLDDGATWAPTAVVAADQQHPLLAIEPSGTIVLAWTQLGSVRITRSLDGGATWTPAVLLRDMRTEYEGDYSTIHRGLAAGPGGQLAVLAHNAYFPGGLLFSRGWYKP